MGAQDFLILPTGWRRSSSFREPVLFTVVMSVSALAVSFPISASESYSEGDEEMRGRVLEDALQNKRERERERERSGGTTDAFSSGLAAPVNRIRPSFFPSLFSPFILPSF